MNGLKASASPIALGVALLAGPALAQTADTTKPPPDNTQVQEVIVTGSLIRRTNIETPSPVTVLTVQELKTSGFDALSSVLTNVTANGAGTLSNNNSLAFAGGASGVALRGLSVGATLTLVDGHRLAPYPLSDDGERQFTDVQSIPIGAVESVEVDKDGASSIYGSDAIAGVVNVKLKEQITGLEAMAEGGTSQHGGGTSQHYAVSAGKGDLSLDGYNVFIAAEYRQQDGITLNQRSDEPWAGLNFTSIGGNTYAIGDQTNVAEFAEVEAAGRCSLDPTPIRARRMGAMFPTRSAEPRFLGLAPSPILRSPPITSAAGRPRAPISRD